MNEFLDFSAAVTSFTKFELYGTGQAVLYFETVQDIVGEATLKELLKAYRSLDEWKRTEREELLRGKVLESEKLGPVARSIIKLWYVGIWYALPPEWTEKYGASANNVTRTVAPAAYTEGLLWKAIGANPSGAKAPGYASWAEPPQYPAFPILP